MIAGGQKVISIAASVTAIKVILATIRGIRTIRDLFANNAGNTVTLDDFQRVLRAENVQFFVVINRADLSRIHNSFYNTILPTIANSHNLGANDLNQGGLHHTLFNNLLTDIENLDRMFHQLLGVVLHYIGGLHVDDLVSGQFLIVNVLGLLMHMHSTSATLRRIQFNAASLDDPRLQYDTRRVLNIIRAVEDNATGLGALNFVTNSKRVQAVGEVTWQFIPPSTRVYRWNDSYRRLTSTPEAYSQFIRASFESTNQTQVINSRPPHITAVKNLYTRTVSAHVNGFRGDLQELRWAMDRRLAIQIAGRSNISRKILSLQDVEAMIEQREALACIDDPNLAIDNVDIDDGSPSLEPPASYPAALDEYCAKFNIEI